MKYFLTAIAVLCFASSVYAQEQKGPSCQEQLKEVTVQAYNLDTDRDQKERKVAQIQAYAHTLEQKIAQLEKQVSDLKKPTEPKKAE